MDIMELPVDLVPAHASLSVRAQAQAPAVFAGASSSKRLALMVSRALVAGESVEKMTTTLSAAGADLSAWAEVFPDLEDEPDLQVMAATFLRFDISAEQAGAWWGACSALHDAFGHADTMDEVCAAAALGAAEHISASLYEQAWPRLSSLSRHERVLSRAKMAEVAQMAGALAAHEVSEAAIVDWVVQDWEPEAAARITAAGGNPWMARQFYDSGLTSSVGIAQLVAVAVAGGKSMAAPGAES